MALSPKRAKYRKVQRGRVKGNATRGNNIDFGDFALVSLEPFWLTNRQLEAARVALNRKVKRGGKLWVRVFPDKPYCKKPLEVRMGKGKGAPEYWVAVIKPGTILFEMAGIDRELAAEAMQLAGSKLPFKTKFAERMVVE
jgi:large subunit ribosomal protein L16